MPSISRCRSRVRRCGDCPAPAAFTVTVRKNDIACYPKACWPYLIGAIVGLRRRKDPKILAGLTAFRHRLPAQEGRFLGKGLSRPAQAGSHFERDRIEVDLVLRRRTH